MRNSRRRKIKRKILNARREEFNSSKIYLLERLQWQNKYNAIARVLIQSVSLVSSCSKIKKKKNPQILPARRLYLWWRCLESVFLGISMIFKYFEAPNNNFTDRSALPYNSLCVERIPASFFFTCFTFTPSYRHEITYVEWYLATFPRISYRSTRDRSCQGPRHLAARISPYGSANPTKRTTRNVRVRNARVLFKHS